MSQVCREVKKCRICGSKNLYRFLDLGKMPVANGFLKKEDLKKREKKYELAVFFCQDCGLVQLTVVVNPKKMFKNYVYVPSTAKVMMNNFSSLAQEIALELDLSEKDLIIDIGSNDGSLLKFFKAYDCQVLGVDPAENIAKVAEVSGIPTKVAYFNQKTAQEIVKKYGRAKVVTATNVMAHIDDLNQVFDDLKIVLKREGRLITEFPYLLDLVEKNEFDTIYHEHLSYFSLNAWQKLVESHGFEICGIRRLAIHGGSIRLTHKIKTGQKNEAKKTLNYFLKIEKRKGLNSKERFNEFGEQVEKLKKELVDLIRGFRNEGKRIVGYGAAAKGNTLINYFKLGKKDLEFIVDSTSYKQGLYTPGMKIPVKPEAKLLREMPDYALILAWNFAEEIMEKQKEYQAKGGRFIIPIPEVKIV